MSSENLKKVYLGWDRPFLWTVCDHLLSLAADSKTPYDLRNMLLILPSRRAQRRLTELLTSRANLENAILLPPSFLLQNDLITTDHCNTRLTLPQKILIWKSVLEQNFPLVKSFYSEKDFTLTHEIITPLAQYLDTLRTELGQYLLEASQIPLKLALDETDKNYRRWQVADKLITAFNTYLSEHKLDDEFSKPDSLPCNEQIEASSAIFLLACHDLSPQQKKFILSYRNKHFTSLIFADKEHANGFDETGGIIPEYWENCSLPPLPLATMHFSNSSLDTPKEVLNEIKKIQTFEISMPHISVGILENEQIAPLTLHIEEQGYPVLAPGIKRISDSYLGSWIIQLCAVWAHGDVEIRDFLRHPLTKNLLEAVISKNKIAFDSPETINKHLSEDIDTLVLTTLQSSLSPLKKLPVTVQERLSTARSILNDVKIHQVNETISISKNCELIQELLLLLFEKQTPAEDKTLQPSSLLHSPLESEVPEINEILTILENILEFSNSYPSTISPSEFHQLIKDSFYQKELPPQKESGIELLGWYELLLDDAPCKLLTGCNEELIPQKISSDPLLPQKTRHILGLKTNTGFYALNRYQLGCIAQSTAYIRFFASRKNLQNDRLKLSRLILSEEPGESIEILKEFYQELSIHQQTEKNSSEPELPFPFQIPSKPYSHFPLSRLSASAIKSYIRCPYEFFLRYIWKIENPDFSSKEIPIPIQGVILHECSRIITKIASDKPELGSASLISYSHELLDREINERLGKKLSISMKLQIDNLKRKLALFCEWHTDTARQGWLNISSEHPLPESSAVSLSNGTIIPFTGRIDRLDYNPASNTLRIIDIKTSDEPYTFEKCLRRGEWIDPQLPLYGTFLAGALDSLPAQCQSPAAIELLLLNLSSKDTYTEATLTLSEEISTSSIHIAQTVAEHILAAKFFPPKALHASFHERIFGGSVLPDSFEEIDGEGTAP